MYAPYEYDCDLYDYDDRKLNTELEQRMDDAGELMLGLVKELTGCQPVNVQHVQYYLSEICHRLRVDDGSDPVTIARNVMKIEEQLEMIA